MDAPQTNPLQIATEIADLVIQHANRQAGNKEFWLFAIEEVLRRSGACPCTDPEITADMERHIERARKDGKTKTAVPAAMSELWMLDWSSVRMASGATQARMQWLVRAGLPFVVTMKYTGEGSARIGVPYLDIKLREPEPVPASAPESASAPASAATATLSAIDAVLGGITSSVKRERAEPAGDAAAASVASGKRPKKLASGAGTTTGAALVEETA